MRARGSLADLIARADGWPIYCTASGSVRRALVCVLIEGFRRERPDTVFINALAHYRHADDRRRHWAGECESCGAAIVMTRAEGLRSDADAFAGLASEHPINIWVGLEIEDFVSRNRPVAWHAVVFPAAYWEPRFAVEPFECLRTGRWARLIATAEADILRPVLGPSLLVPTP